MRDRIRQLQKLDPPRVTLDKRHGATTLVIREDTAYLERDDDAEWVAACCLAAPAFLAELDTVEVMVQEIGGDLIPKLQQQHKDLEAHIDALVKKLDDTEELLRKETALRTAVQRRARRLALMLINGTGNPTAIAADIARGDRSDGNGG